MAGPLAGRKKHIASTAPGGAGTHGRNTPTASFLARPRPLGAALLPSFTRIALAHVDFGAVIMSHRLQDSIEDIKRMLLALGDQAEEMVGTAVHAVDARCPEAAALVRHAEDQVDKAEVSVEEACLKAIALFQPVANDLRFLVAVMKINSDLERIADLAVDIAGEACKLAKSSQPTDWPFNMADEVRTVREMLHTSLTALVRGDAELAQRVRSQDRQVDALHRSMFAQVERAMLDRVANVSTLVNLLNVSRHLERIADHATNIAEDVIYLTRGNIVRHRTFHTDAA